ncbi:nitrilase-related carbon-nitrogen hydrolase [Escherichia coli]
MCYDLRFPVWSRRSNGADLALYVANSPAPRSLHWQALLTARAIENQAYVAVRSRRQRWKQLHYRGDSRVINHKARLSLLPTRIRQRALMPSCRWRCKGISR